MAEPIRPALSALLRHVRAALEAEDVPDAALNARLIVEHVTQTSRTDAVLDPDRAVSTEQMQAALAMLERRLSGEPVHRIIGARDFYGMTLTLSAETLEPRPDTEVLVDLVLPVVRDVARTHGECRVLDLGTGTGAIALALLKEEPRATALATDISEDALATAAANADISGNSGRFAARKSRWFETVEERFHVIVSNPPYIPSKDISSLEREVRDHDPLAALDGGPDGLDAYRAIAAGAAAHIEKDGTIAVEVGYDQFEAVQAIFQDQGFRLANSARDLGGVMRALMFNPVNS